MAETGWVAVLSSFLSVAIETLTDRDHKKFLEHRKFNRGLIQELKRKMIAFGLIVDAAEEKQFANEGVRKWLLELKDATYEAEDVLDGIQIEYQACQSKADTEDQPTTNKGGKLGNLACCIPILVKRSSSSQDPLKQEMEPKLQEILVRLEDLRQESDALGLSKAGGDAAVPPRSFEFEFDVFLNFRGEDVRFNFLYYVKEALRKEGIKTFYDAEDLRRGEEIEKILEKISASKMSIMIFSKDYASSSYCLDELVKIFECKKTWGHEALPVFYHVPPEVVANQSGIYGKAVRRHEQKGTNSKKVRTWRASLAEAADLAGFVLENKRPEPDDIREIVRGVKEILKKFDSKNGSSGGRKATPLIDEFEGFYGRDANKKAIIDLLISDDDDGSNPGVIPIVGMGGVGKTTLAQHVCNDKAVQEQFKIPIWVSVSVQFDETKITKQIVEKVTGTECPYDDIDQLQLMVKDALNGEKFLLVLDDVWSEDYEKWRQFLIPLRCGAKGSKIIITTRSQRVASKVQTVPTHNLGVLEDEDCWKLFARHACLDVNSAANPSELQEIGKKIVRKCRGLPLAARALGGVLRWETKAEKWEEVLKSEIWDVQKTDILPSLAMSYIHLPSHLRRCFAYCAVFPQDCKFIKEELVALWMSEGLYVQRKGNQSLEEIGDGYFDDLVSRSFFQHSSNCWDQPCFVMHDLMHDLARFVSSQFCYSLEGGSLWNIGETTRHLSYESIKEDVLKKTPFLRSFVLAQQSGFRGDVWKLAGSFNEKVVNELLSTQKPLRILYLSCNGIRELPNSIGNLKHMRHLDLSYSSISLLPVAVTDLFNLEILILRECRMLEELPPDTARLINLCQIDLRGTEKLKGMPPEMGKLKKLSKLSDFVVGENEGSNIKELGYLHNLRGQIFIRGLQNVKNDRDASEANLKHKENLKKLELKWEGDADDSGQVEQVLGRLEPHMQIESIEIWGYGGNEFPNWVGDICFSKLKEFRLTGCKSCICLPPLGQLASLEKLMICDDAVLETIDLDFYGKCEPGEKPFPFLKSLKFIDMKKWKKWRPFRGAFPVLEELELRDCSKLMSVPDHLPILKRFKISRCPRLLSIPTGLHSLKGLEIEDCGWLDFKNGQSN